MKTLADQLRAAMAAKGWTQAELARRSGLFYQQVGFVLSGRRNSPRVIEAMARALGLEVHTVLRPRKRSSKNRALRRATG